jgi:hypothetical protein
VVDKDEDDVRGRKTRRKRGANGVNVVGRAELKNRSEVM